MFLGGEFLRFAHPNGNLCQRKLGVVCVDLGGNGVSDFEGLRANVGGYAVDYELEHARVGFDFGRVEFKGCEVLGNFYVTFEGGQGVGVAGRFEDDCIFVRDLADHEPELAVEFFVDGEEDFVGVAFDEVGSNGVVECEQA